MDTISLVVFAILAVASLSVRVQSFPEGCVKMTGSPSEGKPGEFYVKVYPNLRTTTIVKMMLELSNSACEGKLWRSSNTSSAVMEPMTCSNMSYMEGYGFYAKMSNAAVMWVSEQGMHALTIVFITNTARPSGAITRIAVAHSIQIHEMFLVILHSLGCVTRYCRYRTTNLCM